MHIDAWPVGESWEEAMLKKRNREIIPASTEHK